MSRKDKQHVVPRTYLKQWRIAHDKSFVYGVDFSNKYKKGVQTFGLNDKVFKRRRYYNDTSFQNPYLIEDVLGEDIEPIYNRIMDDINRENNPSRSTRSDIMLWLYVSKMRSPSMRDNFEQLSNFFLKTTERYKNKNISHNREEEIKDYARASAKNIHLGAFTDEDLVSDLLTMFIEELNAKHWRILKSTSELEFWTSDNPGFSPNVDERFAKDTPYHSLIELNSNSVVLFPLSPKYCLEITPFKAGTLLDVCALTMSICFVQASLEHIDYINRGVFYTRNNIVISNRRDTLEYCIKHR